MSRFDIQNAVTGFKMSFEKAKGERKMAELYENSRYAPQTGYREEPKFACAICGRNITKEQDEETGLCTVCYKKRLGIEFLTKGTE